MEKKWGGGVRDRAQNSHTVTGGGRVLTRSKGLLRWENLTGGEKKSKPFVERLQLDGSTNSK